jgi:hypothetical protein
MWTAVGVCVGAAYGLTLGSGFIFVLTRMSQILGADVWLIKHSWVMAATLSIPVILGGLCGLSLFEHRKRRAQDQGDLRPHRSSGQSLEA